jgi:hypothetical protein
MGKARAGRKRKVNVMRHPSGQTVKRKHVEKEDEVRAPAVSHRMRHFRLCEDVAKLPDAETAVGRAHQSGQLSAAQLQAAKDYWSASRRYRSALLIKPVASAGDLHKIHGFDGGEGDEPEYVEDYNRAVRSMMDMRGALRDADNVTHQARMAKGLRPKAGVVAEAVEAWVIEDRMAWGMIGELRVGLNALAKIRA